MNSSNEEYNTTHIDCLKNDIYMTLFDEYRYGNKYDLSWESIQQFWKPIKKKEEINFEDLVQRWILATSHQKNDILLKERIPENIIRELFGYMNKHNLICLFTKQKGSKDLFEEIKNTLKFNMNNIEDEIKEQNKKKLKLFNLIETKECIKNVNVLNLEIIDNLLFFPVFILYFFELNDILKDVEDEKIIKRVQDIWFDFQAVPFIVNCFNYKNIITQDPENDIRKIINNIKQNIEQIKLEFKDIIKTSQDMQRNIKYNDIFVQINLYLALFHTNIFKQLENIKHDLIL